MHGKQKNKKFPKRINPCPIIQAVVELRFDSSYPHSAIFGVIYKEVNKEYPQLQELPILQLPEDIRNNDPALMFKPHYRLSSENHDFFIMVGARVISISNLKPYAGWNVFSERIRDLIAKVEKTKIIDNYTRIGIRYINAFNYNIFKKINLSIKMGKNLDDLNTAVRLEFPKNEFICALQLANNTDIKNMDGCVKGSVIDIDTFIENPKKGVKDLINKGHLECEQFFFSLLKKDFINNELNPEF